ncbi:hypothetical protein MNBD_BACTEROID07-262 [hydrothermal vent metagenome]|uniref:Uncharacterized protein n=1 Tax=hydrothermal vent metagenome TaxID=652676 RepID=A0A3B0VFB7_9ZZZZ
MAKNMLQLKDELTEFLLYTTYQPNKRNKKRLKNTMSLVKSKK